MISPGELGTMRRAVILGFLLFVGLVAPLICAAAADIPAWLAEAALVKVADHPPETEAVYLLDERVVTVRPDGTFRANCRVALRILRPGGIDQARQLAVASGFDTKILSMKGWGVTEGRKTAKVTDKDVLETGLAPDTLYTDICIKILNVPGVEVGSLVGFEWEEERKPPSLEDAHTFQGSFPSERSRYSVALPEGWSVDAYWAHWPPVEPRTWTAAAPGVVTWELNAIPAIGEEPQRPKLRAVAARLVVRFKSPQPDRRCFSGWPDIGAWYEGLSKECRVPTPGIVEKARALVEGVPDPFARLRALADFVQKNIRYVAIEIGIGGFQPHSAAGVLANLYGDCKDKATLLAALLDASGVESYFLIVHSDRGSVDLDSPPSLYSFNHVVLAIRLPDDVADEGLPAVVRHPRLGRLLVFDPTFPYTALGWLPFYLQGNTALLVAEGSGELLPLPHPAPEANLLERRGRFALDAIGTLQGEIEETRRGALADSARATLLNATDLERRKHFETFLANFFAGFSIQSDEIAGLHENAGDLVFRYRFSVPNFAKKAGGMTIVRPRIVGDKREKLESNDDLPRRYPIDFAFVSEQRDEFTIELAEDYEVDGLPPEAVLDAGFAVYKSSTESHDRALVYRREYRLLQPALPADRFEEAVRFYRAMDAEQRQSVLLKKK
jgi:transglutaminase-like putative cysteine protease